MATYRTARELTIGPGVRSVGHFVLHIGEMLLAMFVGMAIFGALFSGILLVAGTDCRSMQKRRDANDTAARRGDGARG